LGDDTALYADAAYSLKETRDKLERFGIADQVQRKGYPPPCVRVVVRCSIFL
jgi:IS5 family transposase